MSSSEVTRWGKKWFTDIVYDQTHKLSAPFQWGDNHVNLNLLNKLPERTKEIQEFIYFEALSSHNASKKMGE